MNENIKWTYQKLGIYNIEYKGNRIMAYPDGDVWRLIYNNQIYEAQKIKDTWHIYPAFECEWFIYHDTIQMLEITFNNFMEE